MMTVSEYIFDFLQQKGCQTVYMVSGSSAMWLTDALKRNEKLQAVCCQHEQAAAMAADGVGRMTGAPGVALVTIGPGATNAVTGVAGAFVDSSPMIVLSGQISSPIYRYQKESRIRQKGTQSLMLENMTADITKYFAVILDEKDVRYHLERAYYEATHGRKGPVWLDVPIDVQNKKVPDVMEGFSAPEEKAPRTPIPEEEIAELLKNARKPLILAGYGVLSSHAKDDLRQFAEKYEIPVVTSRGGIGAMASDHPLFIGRPGSYGDRASHFAIADCDLLFILGSRLAMSTVGYYPQRFAPKATKVMVDIDEKELGKGDVPVDIAIRADLQDFFRVLRHIAVQAADHGAWLRQCRGNKAKYPVVLPEYAEEEGINSYFFTAQLSDKASDKAAVVVDTGSVCNVVSQAWQLKEGQTFTISGGLSCMGFWASAIGVAACAQEVVALAGDGSTQMNIQELATLAYYRLPIKLFVYNNHGYMLIRHNQHNYMNDRFLGVGPDSGVPAVDFCKVAGAYGLSGVKIETKEEIAERLDEVFAMEGPVVCEVMVQEFGIMAPRIASRVMPDGSLKAAEFEDLWPFLDKT